MENAKKSSPVEENQVSTGWKAKIPHYFMTISFSAVLIALFSLNIGTFFSTIRSAWAGQTTTQDVLIKTENDFQAKVYGRSDFIDLYGITLRSMNEKIIGNFNFVKDDRGIIQRVSTEIRYDKFLNSMHELHSFTEKNHIPLVYITLPVKTRYLTLAEANDFVFDGQQSHKAGTLLQEEGIDCLNLDAVVGIDPESLSYDEFFFRTDVHCSTYAEFWMAKLVAEHLTDKYGLIFPNMNRVFDLENYTVDRYEFIGNTARSAGKYFTELDHFEIYKPKYDTNVSLNNPSASESRSGDFEEVMLNGYENNSNINEYTYWVTNFGHFQSPFYEYTNDSAPVQSPCLLVICDSLFMRGFSYLALASQKLTVLDPRYFAKQDYLAMNLATEKYDAIIVVGSSNAFFASQFKSCTAIPDLPSMEMISEEEYGKWIGNSGCCVEACNDVLLKRSISMTIDPDAQEVSLRGWAADFTNGLPLQELYLEVGDFVMPCRYGWERPSVAEFFGSDDYRNTGFTVSFPASLLEDGKITEISFYGVSADGEYLYGPSVFQITQG